MLNYVSLRAKTIILYYLTPFFTYLFLFRHVFLSVNLGEFSQFLLIFKSLGKTITKFIHNELFHYYCGVKVIT